MAAGVFSDGGGRAEVARQLVAADRIAWLGEPEDAANLGADIVAPGSRFLHGSLIELTGGQTQTV